MADDTTLTPDQELARARGGYLDGPASRLAPPGIRLPPEPTAEATVDAETPAPSGRKAKRAETPATETPATEES